MSAAVAIPAFIKAALASKNLLPILGGAAFFGGDVLREIGGVGERNIMRDQLALQKLMGESTAKAQRMTLKESRKQTKEYLKELAKLRREQESKEFDRAMMQTFINSLDRQAAITAQAIQGVTNINNSGMSAPMGMIDIMRSAY